MSDVVIEKLVQKTSNMLEEVGEVNMLIRRLTPTQETLNRIHERVDAVHGVLKQLEKGVQLDEKMLEQLQAQCRLLDEEMQIVKKEEESLKAVADRLEVGFGALRGRLDQFELREEKWSISNGQQVGELMREVQIMRRVGMVLAGLTVVCMIVLALR
jgi:chromosome segregation ATPase